MDLDPFVRIGIDTPTMRFLDTFLLHCLLSDSPPDSAREISALARNQHRAAARGREDGLLLERGDELVPLRAWAGELLAQCEPIAATLDAAHGGSLYRDALGAAQAGLREPQTLPSARVLATMRKDFEGSYVRFVRAQSEQTYNALLGLPYPQALQAHFAALAAKSLTDQRAIEAADTMPFETYRQQYLASGRLEASPRMRGGAG